jgi:hypothetical protein
MARTPEGPPRTDDTNRAIVSDVHPPIRNQQPITDDPRERRRNDRDTRSDNRTPKTDSPAPPRSQDPFQLPNGQRPRLVNSKSFEMDYEIKSIGPSGISKFELWGTRDAGRTWTSYGVDKDNRPPMRVSVEEEGLYGFRSTVQSGNGLGSPPPRSGDEPELLILVDLTKPKVRLNDVQAGANEHAGELLIRWEAADAGLADHPVTLFFADNPAGPWSIIVANLNASGSYNWRPDDRAPDRAFLRVEARDEAGNIGSYQTQEPVALDRARPEVRLRGVRPITDSAVRVQQYQFYR